jgi:mannose-1-phosphate guanylyltransferase
MKSYSPIFTINENTSKLEVNMILPVIMAGGTGSRLWPMSRERFPKQFLKLYGEQSMLQETVTRLYGLK